MQNFQKTPMPKIDKSNVTEILVLAIPILMYRCKNWTINRKDKKKVETAEIKFLRLVTDLQILVEVSYFSWLEACSFCIYFTSRI
ncbi:hypothetical protein C0J52_15641 [Blattella germanica]|nr:hypothetical protein C0J52_15641 [Blattella germanica]